MARGSSVERTSAALERSEPEESRRIIRTELREQEVGKSRNVRRDVKRRIKRGWAANGKHATATVNCST